MQENAFLKLGSVKGKAKTNGFKEQIVCQSMSYAVSQAAEYHEGQRITHFTPLTVNKVVDGSTPELAQKCAEKEKFPEAVFTVVDEKNEPQYKVTLNDVLIQDISIGFSNGDPNPAESLSLSYRGAKWEYMPTKTKGSYDLDQNKTK